MKFSFLFITIFALIISFADGQNIDSARLDNIFKKETHDTSDVNFLTNASILISFVDADSAIVLGKKALAYARDLNYRKGESDALNACGEAYHFLGDYPQALKLLFEALQINRDMKDSYNEAQTLGTIGLIYNNLGQYRLALQTLMNSVELFQKNGNKNNESFELANIGSKYNGSFELSNIGDAYYYLNMPDSALYYQQKAYKAYLDYPTGVHLKSFILQHMGIAFALLGKKDSALEFYNEAIQNALQLHDKLNASTAMIKVAELYHSTARYDSAIYYARLSFENAKRFHSKQILLDAGDLLAKLYKNINKPDSALFYLNTSVVMRDSLYGPEKMRQMQLLMLDEQQKQTTLERQQEQYRNKIRYTALLSGLGVFLLLVFLLWRNIQHKKKSNNLLQREKQNVEQAYDELKATQAQLIQSEKMASLGELTAGIAHEIQNPLNFVNNFSEVNIELIEELKSQQSNLKNDEVDKLLDDIASNEEKINHHGKRADAIVKSMLQHSRQTSGTKEPTDINALCDEYVRLSYHGIRAKNKSFEAKFETYFDNSIGKINVVPQDIGRVILNLINNAFYAVSEKKKLNPDHYEPTVIVSTKKLGDKVEIKVKDNGNGIPKSIKEKIFQPFFTTKPTGQGTGLGLSLSYDIVKAHGGTIKVESEEGQGTTFIITLVV
ncbi:MAG TPA: ATP-binding protein [Chitinophagaceae bacterium]|nr:ATP-binding protein [Chitinophagaceae bacterium]